MHCTLCCHDNLEFVFTLCVIRKVEISLYIITKCLKDTLIYCLIMETFIPKLVILCQTSIFSNLQFFSIFGETLKNQGIEGRAVQTALEHLSLPEKWRPISVWTWVRVTLPLAGVSTGKVETRAIYARPSMRKDQLPCFDTVLVDLGNDNPDPQVGLSCEWLPSKAKNIC